MCRARSARVTATPVADQAQQRAGAGRRGLQWVDAFVVIVRLKLQHSNWRSYRELLLDNWTKSGLGSPRDGTRASESAIAGTGFIGAVHARSARLAGARLAARRRLVARDAPRRRPTSSAPIAPSPRPRSWCATRTSTSSTSARRTTFTCRWPRRRSPPASTWSARSRSRSTPPGAQRLVDAAAESGRQAAVPVRLPLLPDGARGARARAQRARPASVRLLHGTYLQDWLLRPERRQLARRRAARRALARVRRHRLALVRPRASSSPGHRIDARCPRGLLTAVPERLSADGRRRRSPRGDGGGEARPSRPRTPPSSSSRPTTARSARSSSARSRAGRKNRLWIELDGAEEALAFDQEKPGGALVRPARGRRRSSAATPSRSRRRPRASRRCPRGHPQGYADCFDALRRRLLRRRSRPARRRTGCPTFADGLRAARITDAVLASARERALGRRGGGPEAVARVKLGFLTSCMPERSLEEIAAWAGANGYEALELAAWPQLGDRPFTASHVKADAFDEAEADRVRRALDEQRPRRCRRSPTTTTTSHPDPAEREALPRAPARLHRRGGRARRRARRHVHRPRPRPQRRREPARGRARLPAARRLRGRARRAADDRELRDGGLAPGRLPGQPRLLARALGVDVRARAVPELRPVAPALAGHRPGRGAEAVRRPRRARAREGRRDVPGRAQPLRLLRPHLDARGGPVGHGLVALPDPRPRRRSTSAATSTRSTRAASTACCRSSTRTRSGAARPS